MSSPFRRNLAETLFFRDAIGAEIQDVDENWYIDYVLAWGPLILGHKHPAIVQALRDAAEGPHNYGAQHELEFVVAEQICNLVPCAERIALTSSGSEAVQLAMRLARAYTRRNLLLKFEGHYHGWMDSALLSYHASVPDIGSAQKPNVVLGSRGQVHNAADNVLVLPWNDLEAAAALFATRGEEIAGIITEPVLCNSGCLMPAEGFLPGLRRLATQYGAVLIFDEVITGFRIAPGGAQSVFGVTPDIATLGKAIGGGLPLSVVAGRKDILELIVDGGVVFGGTFNGNPLSLAGAHATMTELNVDNGHLLAVAVKAGEKLMNGIREAAKRRGVPVEVSGFGTAFSIHFTETSALRNYRDTLQDDHALFKFWLRECLKEGIYLLPDGRIYISIVHTEKHISRTLEAFDRVLARCPAAVRH
ncbi:MAG: aspartate aminotransferase family protein [Bryobacteraceae bacterium]